jgi:mitochondrial import receptor subunit TOM40
MIIPRSISLLFMNYYDTHRRSVTLCEGAVSQPPPPPPLPPGSSAPPPPPPPSPTTTTNGGGVDTIADIAKSVSSYPNPGPYEQAMMSCGKPFVSLDTFDGFRCDISKQLSPYMAVFHSFWMGTKLLPDGKKSSYTFMTQVANEDGLLMSRVDPNRGSFDGRIHRSLFGGIALGKLQVGCSTESSPSDQLLSELDFGASTWTGNIKYGSMGGGIVYGLNYFQSITPNLAMGGEGMYISANSNLLSTYTLRYQFQGRVDRDDNDSITEILKSEPQQPTSQDRPGSSSICIHVNTAQSNISCNYKRCVTPGRMTLAAELQCNPMTLDSQLLLGTEFKLQRSKLNFCIDGNTGRIQSLVEAKLGMAPGSPTLNFSADVNHFTDEMRFGYGINIEG